MFRPYDPYHKRPFACAAPLRHVARRVRRSRGRLRWPEGSSTPVRSSVRPIRRARRGAFTVLELLIGISIMVMILGSLGALASAVRSSADYCSSRAMATEHARVVLERIARMANEAYANERFPGFVVLDEKIGSSRYPDTLVIWHKAPLDDPNRLPRYDELVVICPNPSAPHQLVEIRSTSPTPLSNSVSQWGDDIGVFKTSMVLDTDVLDGSGPAGVTYPAVTLTELLRTCAPSAMPSARRGAVRFESRLKPSEEDWEDTSIAWSALPWVQDIFGPETGLRQAWLRIELQLVPPVVAVSGTSADASQVIPFFGSAAVYYQMHQERRL